MNRASCIVLILKGGGGIGGGEWLGGYSVSQSIRRLNGGIIVSGFVLSSKAIRSYQSIHIRMQYVRHMK